MPFVFFPPPPSRPPPAPVFPTRRSTPSGCCVVSPPYSRRWVPGTFLEFSGWDQADEDSPSVLYAGRVSGGGVICCVFILAICSESCGMIVCSRMGIGTYVHMRCIPQDENRYVCYTGLFLPRPLKHRDIYLHILYFTWAGRH